MIISIINLKFNKALKICVWNTMTNQNSKLIRPAALSIHGLSLEKWFPLQGERAHSLNFVVVCMYVNRKEEE